MGLFEHFPYTNYHDLNLDKILERTKEAEEAVAASEAAVLAAAADMAAADAKATLALSTANTASNNATTALNTANTADGNATTALNTANTAAGNASTALTNSTNALHYAQAKAQILYEIFYDVTNSELTVTDCTSGTVISSEADPLACSGVAGRILKGVSGNFTPMDAASYVYPNCPEVPLIKFVYGSGTSSHIAYPAMSYQTLFGLMLSYVGPNGTARTFYVQSNQSFTFANASWA